MTLPSSSLSLWPKRTATEGAGLTVAVDADGPNKQAQGSPSIARSALKESSGRAEAPPTQGLCGLCWCV